MTQINKNIVWGINSENKSFGIAETFFLTPLFRYNHNSEMQFLNNEHGKKCASIFKGMCKISLFDNPKDIHHQIEPYGDNSKHRHDQHQIKNFLDIFGFTHDNYIPWIDLSISDITRAKEQLSKYRNPITISPFAGGFSNNCPSALSRMIDIQEWQKIVDYLTFKGFDVICLTAAHNNIQLDNVSTLFDFNFRQLAALIKICGVHIGIENGLFHAAIASGAKCFSIVPSFGFNGYINFCSYGYIDSMWIHEPNRVKYYLFNEVDKLLGDL